MTQPYTIDWVRQQLKVHRSKIADLEAMERVMLDAVSPQQTIANTPWPAPLNQMVGPSVAPKSLLETIAGQYGHKKISILSALAGFEEGLSTSEIVDHLTKRGIEGMTVANTSPQLSGFGKNNLVSQNNGKWRITNAGRNYLAQKI